MFPIIIFHFYSIFTHFFFFFFFLFSLFVFLSWEKALWPFPLMCLFDTLKSHGGLDALKCQCQMSMSMSCVCVSPSLSPSSLSLSFSLCVSPLFHIYILDSCGRECFFPPFLFSDSLQFRETLARDKSGTSSGRLGEKAACMDRWRQTEMRR